MFKARIILALLIFSALVIKQAHAQLEQKSAEQIRIETVSKQFANALNHSDMHSIRSIWNAEPLALETYDLLYKDKKNVNKARFVKSFKESFFSKSVTAWFTTIERAQGSAKYIKLFQIDGQQRALVRLDLNDKGMNFFELIFDENLNKIVDLYTHSSGQLLSESMLSIIALTTPNSDNLLGRLFGFKRTDQHALKVFRQVGKFNRQGKLAEAYQAIKTLSPDIQSNRLISVLMVNFSAHTSDKAYAKELDNLMTIHGNDPALAFLLVDHYFFKKQFLKAVKSIELVEKRIGEDSFLKLIKANAFLMGNQNQQALKEINRAIELENDYEDFYWVKGDVLNSLGLYKALTELLDKMRDQFNLAFDPTYYEKDPAFKEFANSVEFKQWRKQYD